MKEPRPTTSSRPARRRRQERWENQSGWSPATIAREIAGLVCAADIARAQRRHGVRRALQGTADDWQRRSRAGPPPPTARTPQALLPAPDQGRQPQRRHDVRHRRQRPDRTSTSAPSSTRATSSSCASASSPRRPDDPQLASGSSTSKSASTRPNGRFWHRFNFDGYGEKRDGSPWDIDLPSPGSTATTRRARLADLRRRARRVRAGRG